MVFMPLRLVFKLPAKCIIYIILNVYIIIYYILLIGTHWMTDVFLFNYYCWSNL